MTYPPGESDQVRPVVPLEYSPPPAPVHGRARDLWIGIFISLFFSLGCGLMFGGLMMANGVRDSFAIPTAFGFGFIMLAASLAGLLWFLRRAPR